MPTLIDSLKEVPIEEVVAHFNYSLKHIGGSEYQIEGSRGVADYSSVKIDVAKNTGFYGRGYVGLDSLGLFCLLETGDNSYKRRPDEVSKMDRVFLSGAERPIPTPRKITPPPPIDRSKALAEFRNMRIGAVHPMDYYHQRLDGNGLRWYDEMYKVDTNSVNTFHLGEIYKDDSPWPAATIPWVWHRRQPKTYSPQHLLNMQMRFHHPAKAKDGKEINKYKYYASGLDSRILFNLDAIVTHKQPVFIFEGAMKVIKAQQEYHKANLPIQAIGLPNVEGWKGWGNDPNKANWHNIFTPQSYNFLSSPIPDIYVLLDPDAHIRVNDKPSISEQLCTHLATKLPHAKIWNCYSSVKPDEFFGMLREDTVWKFQQSIINFARRIYEPK